MNGGGRGWWLAAAGLAVACGADPEPAQAPVPRHGVDVAEKVVSVGVLNDESGPVAAIGRPWGVGLRILERQINAGGSGYLPEGWKLRLVGRDHGYSPQRAVEAYDEIRADVLFIAASFGTPNTLPLRKRLARDGMVAFPVSLSSRHAEFELTPPIGASYRVESMRALDWMVQQAGGAAKVRLGLVSQEDDYGTDGREAARAAAGKLGVRIVAEQTCLADQTDYTRVVGPLKAAGATHVLLTTVPGATAPILGLAAQLGYQPVWVGNSPSWLDRFFDARVVPPAIFQNYHWVTAFLYWGEKVPLMKPFLAAYEKFGRELAPPDYYILAGYAAGLVEMQALTRTIESGDLTRAGFLKALRGMQRYDAYGATPDPVDYTQFPYATGTKARVLKPDFANQGWIVAGPYARPSTLDAVP